MNKEDKDKLLQDFKDKLAEIKAEAEKQKDEKEEKEQD